MKNNILKTVSLSVAVFLLSFFGAIIIRNSIAAWSGPLGSPPSSNVEAPLNVGPTSQTKTGNLNIGGSLAVTGAITASGGKNICLADGTNCQPTSTNDPRIGTLGASPNNWCVATGGQIVCTTATPTTTSVAWGSITGIPAGFADGTDDTGITTETDPQVNTLTANQWCVADSTGTSINCNQPAPSTGYTAGNGISISAGNQISMFTCAAGKIPKTDATGNWTCQDDLNSGTSYTGSNGIVISGSSITSDTAYLQKRIVWSCNAGDILTAINADGTVSCTTPTYIPVYQ